jgi:hypothetical protein
MPRHHAQVDFGGFDMRVAEELLHVADIGSAAQEIDSDLLEKQVRMEMCG